jgi:hypothetical protein
VALLAFVSRRIVACDCANAPVFGAFFVVPFVFLPVPFTSVLGLFAGGASSSS